jgi:hypothetical protein
MMMLRLTEQDAMELAAQAAERGVEARACLDARLGWVVRAIPPFHHEGDVVIRSFSDLCDMLSEAAWG